LSFRMMLAAVVLVLPTAVAWAQTADEKHGQALSSSYREYSKGTIDAEAATAMSQCGSNAAGAIPVLEKHLKAGKVTLPSR
jgi:predicted outer membrane protein